MQEKQNVSSNTVSTTDPEEPSKQSSNGKELTEDYGIITRLPNGLLVKIQDQLSHDGKVQACIYGGQLAKVQDSKLVNLQGDMLTYPKHDEIVDLNELLQGFVDPSNFTGKIADSLQEGQIMSLPSGEIVSLKKMANDYWNLEEFKEGNLCRVQGDKFFSLKKDQIIKFERGNIVRIQNEKLSNLSPIESKDIDLDNEQILKIQSDQLAVLQNGKFVRSNTLEELTAQPMVIDGNIAITWRFPLDYLYIRKETPLSDRQKSVALAPSETPIGELFTFFDCTDYIEPDADKKAVGVLSHAKQKKSLNTGDYLSLTKDYFSGRIDTHGGRVIASNLV